MAFYSVLRGASMLGGLVLIATGAFLNASKAAETEGTFWSPICLAIVALAFCSAIVVPVMGSLWRHERRTLTVFAFVGLVCSECYALQLSAERLLAAREQRSLQVMQSGNPFALAKDALDRTVREREIECVTGFGSKCSKLREVEKTQRAELGSLRPPAKVALLADATGLPNWLVEIVPSLLFSVALQLLGFVLVGFAGHSSEKEHLAKVVAASAPEPDETEQVVDWCREFRRRHGKNPSITSVQANFGLTRTTAWRRLNSA
jgi:multidrug efflux pump subunit AcrB